MKPLKEYGLKVKDLKEVIGSLNDAELLKEPIKISKVKGEIILPNFLDSLDALSKKELENLPEDVATFYEALPQEVFDDSGEKAEEPEAEEPEEDEEPEAEEGDDDSEGDDAGDEEADPELTSECPSFLKGCNEKEDDCKQCKKDFPDEFKACADATKKAAKKAAPKKKATPKLRTRYGHIVGSMSGDIDEMLFKGMDIKKMAKKLAKDHEREEKAAQAKIRGHVKHLENNKGIKVTDKDGVLTAKKEFAEGYSKDNTNAK